MQSADPQGRNVVVEELRVLSPEVSTTRCGEGTTGKPCGQRPGGGREEQELRSEGLWGESLKDLLGHR